jgi:hypothetical protein
LMPLPWRIRACNGTAQAEGGRSARCAAKANKTLLFASRHRAALVAGVGALPVLEVGGEGRRAGVEEAQAQEGVLQALIAQTLLPDRRSSFPRL